MGCCCVGDVRNENYKRQFFYCFTDEEIQLIEERANEITKYEYNNYLSLYSKFIVDYTEENNDKLAITEYMAVYIDEKYNDQININSAINGFCNTFLDVQYCLINKKEKINPKIKSTENDMVDISFNLKKKYRDKIFKNYIILEFSFIIKPKREYNSTLINIKYDNEPMTCSVVIKYDKNKTKFESDEDFTIACPNENIMFNKNDIMIGVVDTQKKIVLNKEDEEYVKSKFSEEEMKQIYSSLDELILLPMTPNLIYEKIIHNIKDKKDYISGSFLILNTSFSRGAFTYFYTSDIPIILIEELKMNDKTLSKKEEDNNTIDENYYISTNEFIEFKLKIDKSLILIEFDFEGIPDLENGSFCFDPKSIFKLHFQYGTSFYYEIARNGHMIELYKSKTTIKQIEDKNKLIYKGFYDINKDDYNDKKYIKEKKKKDKNYNQDQDTLYDRFKEWINKKIDLLLPQCIYIINDNEVVNYSDSEFK